MTKTRALKIASTLVLTLAAFGAAICSCSTLCARALLVTTVAGAPAREVGSEPARAGPVALTLATFPLAANGR